MMYTDIAIHTMRTAEGQLDEFEESASGIRKYASELSRQLRSAALMADTLERDGWAIKFESGTVTARHPEVNSVEEAQARLTRLGILDHVYDIAEWDDSGKGKPKRLTAV